MWHPNRLHVKPVFVGLSWPHVVTAKGNVKMKRLAGARDFLGDVDVVVGDLL